MAGISSTDIAKITGKYLTFGADTDDDYTTADATNSIKQIVQSEVFPVFRTAGYQVPSDYPTTDFSTDATEILEINQNIAYLVAYRMALQLPRYAATIPNAVQEWGLIVLGQNLEGAERVYGWLDKIRRGWIKYSGVSRETTRAPMVNIHVSDTTTLFPDSDNAEGDESNSDDW